MKATTLFATLRLVNLYLAVFAAAGLPLNGGQYLKLGFGGGLSSSSHAVSFVNLEGADSPFSLPFTTGSGLGFNGFHRLSYKLVDPLWAGLQIDISHTTLRFRADELLESDDGTVQAAEHHLDAALTRIGIEPFANFSLGSELDVSLGLQFGFAIDSDHEELRIGSDSVDGMEQIRREVLSKGPLPNLRQGAPALRIALGYSRTLASNLAVQARLFARRRFDAPVNGLDWTVTDFGIDLALLFSQEETERILFRDTLHQRDTIVRLQGGLEAERHYRLRSDTIINRRSLPEGVGLISTIHEEYVRVIPEERPLLDGNLEVRFLDENGEEYSEINVSVIERSRRTFYSILPYVFFEADAAELPQRYRRLQPQATPSYVLHRRSKPTALGIYYDLLNIIGRRMRDHPAATLQLTGCNGGSEGERGGRALSRSRAEAVQRYLMRVWDIDDGRLQLHARDLPAFPSLTNDERGLPENRRVELESDTPAILAPLEILDTIRIASPPAVRFYPLALSEAGLADWRLDVNSGRGLVKSFSGEGRPDRSIDWYMSDDLGFVALENNQLDCVLHLRDIEEQSFQTSTATIRFHLDTLNANSLRQEATIERFSMIFFAYDDAAMAGQYQYLLDEIEPRLASAQRISIVGTTDVIGDENYNRRLSLSRAQTIASLLHIQNAAIRGDGEDARSFPNALPEGRFYSRRVDIYLER